MFPRSPLTLCRGRSWSPRPIIRRTDRDQGAGMRDVLHLFYLFNRIRPPSPVFPYPVFFSAPFAEGSSRGQGCSHPSPCGRRTALAGGISSGQWGFAFVLHFKKTRHLFPFGKPITQTDHLFPCYGRYFCGSLYFGPIWSTLSPQRYYCISIQFFLWPRNPWKKGRVSCSP